MTEKDSLMKIGDVAKNLGITTRTIRYYEEVGLMGDSRTTPGRVRLYNEQEIIRLKFILKLKDLGISLKEMHEIAVNYELNNRSTDKILPQLIMILDRHRESLEKKIENLISLSKEINEYRNRVVECMNRDTELS